MAETVSWVCHDCDVNGEAHKAAAVSSWNDAMAAAREHFDANKEHAVIVFGANRFQRLK